MRYIQRTEAAKMIRRDLKTAFPQTKFSVRCKTYSGGGSIDIDWNDGPTDDQVQEVVGQYTAKGFDGMIDMAYSYNHWLMPDGTVKLAGTSGTEGSMGTVAKFETDKPHPDAEKVHIMTGYLSTHRDLTDGFLASVKQAFAALSESERSKLMDKTEATYTLAPYEMPQSWHLDAELSDFGDNAERLFRRMAWKIAA